MMPETSNTAIIRYRKALEAFSAASMDEFLTLCTADIEFRDPFNHTYTKDHFRLALEHMLDTVEDLRFDIHETWGHERSWVLKWTFTGRTKLIGELEIPGLSEITLNDDGLVCRHIDYWDGSEHFLQKIPGLGTVVRAVLRPLRVG